MFYTSWDFVQVITCTKSFSHSSLMFGNMFLLLTFQITVGFNIGIPFKETVVM